ncbi:complement C1q-like protein 4 [Ostrea edulis]|uniref:complement C1q-like protein 4 n=1 Tax=Ostrea edulis TaxID=37623 RepID=UPI002094F56A|nr:complement C1q-like protein 4 [Ostrea edulis]
MKCTYRKELLLLLVSIYAAVNGDYDKGITLTKGQCQTFEKSVNKKVDGSSCCNPKPKTPVAFHAELSSDRTYKAGSPWVFDKVVTNVGNAYNPATGKFTTPSKGIYLFNWYTLAYPGKKAHAGLYVNGKIKGRQATNNIGNAGKHITSDSSIVLALEKGDLVYIMDAHGITSEVKGRWTAFGGVQQN